MSKKVFVDLGHGGNDPGACGNGLRESDIVLAVGLRVKYHLLRYDVEVMLSRESDKTVSLAERTNMANRFGADALVSIHCNGAIETAHGIETYCYQFKYRALADRVHGKLIENKSLYYVDRGVKEADFHMLRESNMDAALVEMAFISNERDAQLLRNMQEEYAIAIAKGILEYLGIAWINEGTSNPVPTQPEQPKPPTPSKIDVFYKVWTAEDGWLPEVKNLTDYAGVFGHAIRGLMIRLSSGDVDYKVSTLRSNGYYPTVRNHEDYAGDLKNNVDKVQIFNNKLKYRVRLLNGRWLPWVIGDSDFAGLEGYSIDAIEIDSI